MEITFKKFKVANNMSDDSLAYTADVYIDGKKVGWVRDTGQGGGSWCEWDEPADSKRMDVYLAMLPDDDGIPWSQDYFFSDMAEKLNHIKWLKAYCRRHLVYKLPGDDAGTYHHVSGKPDQGARDFLSDEHPDAIIQNDLAA